MTPFAAFLVGFTLTLATLATLALGFGVIQYALSEEES